MDLAIFDLDHTLLHDDSDRSWNDFLVDINVLDAEQHGRDNQRWYEAYTSGRLDIVEYNRWAFRLHRTYGSAQVTEWRDQYVRERAPRMIAKRTPEVLDWHRSRGHRILVITATSRFVAEPIVKLMGIDDMLGLENEVIDGEYTGELIGIPTFQGGKVDALDAWLADKPALDETWFYSDSHNDVPLLERVDNPIVVDGDETLLGIAKERGWQSVSFRE